MAITVAGRKMTVTDATRQYAEEKIGNAMKVMDIDPLDAEVVLSVKKNPSIALPCVCEVTIRTRGNVVRVEEEEQDMFSAIDVAAAKVLRQLRKYKTRVIDRKVRAGAHGDPGSIRTMEGEELDLDALMADLSADEEVKMLKEAESILVKEALRRGEMANTSGEKLSEEETEKAADFVIKDILENILGFSKVKK